MKKIFVFFTLLLISGVLFAGDNVISYFNASSNGDRIKIEWKSTPLDNEVELYEIERACHNGNFSFIDKIDAKGYSYTYTYSDENALKPVDKTDALQSGTIYSYRLKIVKKDNSSEYSNSINVSHSTSGVKRTWGMIKEMFR